MRPLTDGKWTQLAQDAPTPKIRWSRPPMFLSAMIKAHSDKLAENTEIASLSVDDEAVDESAATRTSESVNAEALAALEKRLIELPAIHRARWL